MNKNKKTISLLIIIILSFVIFFIYLYSFNEAKKLAIDQVAKNKILADLEIARQRLELEKRRLAELRGESYTIQVSQAQYLKTKALVEKTNIFFKDADTLNPQIKIKTKDKVVADEINIKRLKINQLLQTWNDNNENSIETDQALINQIKIALLYIQSYVKQLETIVADLSTENSGLSNEEINSYRNIVTSSVSEIAQIITTINEAEIIINTQINDSTNTESNEITEQIEVVEEDEEVVIDLENIINSLATSTISSTSTNIIETVDTDISEESVNVTRRPRIVNPEPAIIYIQNPAPYKDTGVDINTSAEMAPLQDW